MIRTDMACWAFRTGWIAEHRPCERSEAIHTLMRSNGLLRRGACHRARIRATRWLLAMTKEDSRRLVAEIRLHRAVDLDGERIAVAILGGARGHAHPALTDAILLDIGFLDALESNADVARQHLLIVVRAFRIGRQTVRQLVAHGVIFLVHSSASISLTSPSGLAVGACRATTLPARSTRNLVKFHLIDVPSRPDFLFFRY